jgi:hypothetical protein
MERMLYGIHARKGIVMLTGEIGSGKTLLSRAVILKLPRSRYEIGLVSNPTIPGNEFLGEILFQLGLDPNGTRAEQLRRLNDQLLANYHRKVDTVVVDEAQAIEHDRLFEELRLLSNFQLNDRFLITLVLVGQPELKDRIAYSPASPAGDHSTSRRIFGSSRDESLYPRSPLGCRVQAADILTECDFFHLLSHRRRMPIDKLTVRLVPLLWACFWIASDRALIGGKSRE